MYALIVTPNHILHETLALVVTSLAPYTAVSATNGPAAISLMTKYCPEFILVDGCLPRDEMLSIMEARARLAPGSRIAVLVDPAGPDPELTLAGAEILPVYSRPAAELYQALARLVCGTAHPGVPMNVRQG